MAANLPTDAWKRTTDDYLSSAKALFASMVQNGFDPRYPVPIDPAGELLGGAHRVACAIALGLESVPVTRRPDHVWAPPWGEEWFKQNGMAQADLERLRMEMNTWLNQPQ